MTGTTRYVRGHADCHRISRHRARRDRRAQRANECIHLEERGPTLADTKASECAMAGVRVCWWLAMLASASIPACASPDLVTGHAADTSAVKPASFGGGITFSAWNGSAIVVYTMDPDGSRRTAITQGQDPSFSPDGKRIAFWRYDRDGGSIYIANADGSVRTVTSGGYQPTWSPDGQKLAYGCGGICIVNLDGTGQTRLTPAAPVSLSQDVCIRDSDPAWSPDGATIAFTRWPDEHIPTSMCLPMGAATNFPFDFWTEVWLVDVDGSNLRPLRDDAGNIVTYAGWPSWSPDGGRLAFYYVNGQEERIDIANVGRSGLVTAVRRSPVVWGAVLGSPAWSPDGTEIIFGTKGGWGFAESSGSGRTAVFSPPDGLVPYSLSWSWGRQ